MAEFVDQDLSGSQFNRVNLSNTTMRKIDLRGLDLRGALMHGARMRGVELCDVEVSGELVNVLVNGVDIAPLVVAELNRRDPDRVKMHPVDADGFREAWTIVQRRWDDTIARARTFDPDTLHVNVDGEWSLIQTLRHLNFAAAAWVGRMILGDPSPWHPLDLPWDEAPGWDGVPWDREARPSLEAVLTVRQQRQAMVSAVIDDLTDNQLSTTVSNLEPGWPRIDAMPFSECLWIVLNEEWEHRNYAERDLVTPASHNASRRRD